MLGLMQTWPLTVDRLLTHAKTWHGGREIVTRSVEGPIVRTTYTAIEARARRLTNALLALGIAPGDRVATLAWNTARHMEAWYAIMGMGVVCHTVNPRLFRDQLRYIINHAQDRIIFTDVDLLPTLMALRAELPSVEHIVVMTDRAHMADGADAGLLCFEELVEQHPVDAIWGGFDENTAAGLCYTSGTTGDPKGVLYSHRSNVLHSLVTLQSDVMGLSARDVVLPMVPMFHANAWGLALSAPAVGAKLVMPGPKLDGGSVRELIETEGVTFAAAVPTVWEMLLDHLRATGARLPHLKRALIGGAAASDALIRAFEDELGVAVSLAWGMTETSPLGTLGATTPEVEALPPEARRRELSKQGRVPFGVEMKLTDDAGAALPHDGLAFGRLKVRGPYIARAYFAREQESLLDADGFLDTEDVATIDPLGFMQITDRAKDLIKSGGEWISSIAIEDLVSEHPKVALAAVIGVPDPKWAERPLLIVKLHAGEHATREEILGVLDGRIARWWIPNEVRFVDEIALGPTGKVDKKRLRELYASTALDSPRANA
ncbi:long-chain-fatty-acid--CoA ligase [Phenylobacterium sp.]|jgi:fatty-acyl-CoA synthase|uniref:long-chain-fatty-acid--CoA ligase n=1 Tax=Phenylobacterium sp. TaxID=1871053 RepID=UPI002E348C2B|nr:long-chain-fatty-acid--CoA ligase [Phenylobacterium sp.]HEX3364152.1 long-chain-fatty-acid--CoA ligase [Phenylobacterium sp.]